MPARVVAPQLRELAREGAGLRVGIGTDLLRQALVGSEWLRERGRPPAVFAFPFGRPHVCLLRRGKREMCLKLASDRGPLMLEAAHHARARAALQGTASRDPLIEAPEIVHADEFVLATELVPVPSPARGEADMQRGVRALGAALGRVHTSPGPLSQVRPMLSSATDLLDSRMGSGRGDGNGEQLRLLARLRADRSVRATVESVRESWQSAAFLHGDLRRSNVLGFPAAGRLWLIDWEHSGRGDPRWDLACVLGELLVLAAERGPSSRRSMVAGVERLLTALIGGYESVTGHPRFAPDLIGDFAAVWLLQQSWEVLGTASGWGRQTDVRLALGLTLAGARA